MKKILTIILMSFFLIIGNNLFSVTNVGELTEIFSIVTRDTTTHNKFMFQADINGVKTNFLISDISTNYKNTVALLMLAYSTDMSVHLSYSEENIAWIENVKFIIVDRVLLAKK